ncbi:hypothetical protein UFOVP1290_66 [uncultured Caudovirales phage]|uniref:Uncharacterized protein n=1 Tax=uncultured Caudovirales phage TaxID=2100421 RepID=A0A6J5RQJ2_9CAUD|nr:hypothetical protein UFOVP1290_66 [uncultured Caudovirales phage]
MSTPTKEKTYTYNVNQSLTAAGSSLATNKQFLLAWVNSMIGLANGYWICMGSSDGVSYDAADGTPYASRWTDASKLVWANSGTDHSWIVLQMGAYNPLVGNVQILIDLNIAAGDGATGNLYMSSSGLFTGGTLTAAPTASDQVDVHPNNTYGTNSLGFPNDSNSVLHVISADDNTATYIINCVGSTTRLCWGIFKPKDAETTSWVNDWVAFRSDRYVIDYGTGENQFTYFYAMAYINSTVSSLYLASESFFPPLDSNYYPIPLNAVVDDNSGEYPLSAIGLWSATRTTLGLKGIIPDLYFGLHTTSTGDTYPGDGSKQWAQFGDFVFPWDGSTPVIV